MSSHFKSFKSHLGCYNRPQLKRKMSTLCLTNRPTIRVFLTCGSIQNLCPTSGARWVAKTLLSIDATHGRRSALAPYVHYPILSCFISLVESFIVTLVLTRWLIRTKYVFQFLRNSILLPHISHQALYETFSLNLVLLNHILHPNKLLEDKYQHKGLIKPI